MLFLNSPNNNKLKKFLSNDLTRTNLFLSWRNNGAKVAVVYGFLMFTNVTSMKNYNEKEASVIACSHKFLWRSQITLFHFTILKAPNFLATNRKQT
jgi:hypothetical protein